MNTSTVKNKFDEHKFLSQSSIGSLYLGIGFILNFIDSMFFDDAIWEHDIYSWILGAFCVVGIVLILRAYRFGPPVLSKNYWFIIYEDEFLNFLNMKGFKWAATALMALLIVVWGFDGVLASLDKHISQKELAGLGIGIYFIAYSLPVVYELKFSR